MQYENVKWAFELENKLYSLIKYKATKELIEDFPNITFTSTDKASEVATFPTVYIHELPAMEVGNDLSNETINAVLETIQVDVYTNSTQKDAKDVMMVIASIMKSLRFDIGMMPEFNNGSAYYRTTARFSRVIGSGDTF